MEGHALAHPEGVDAPSLLGLGELGGQGRYDVGVTTFVVEQPLEYIAGHDQELAVCDVDRIQVDRIGPTPEGEDGAFTPASSASLAIADGLAASATRHAEQGYPREPGPAYLQEIAAVHRSFFSDPRQDAPLSHPFSIHCE